jgi:hypothetical protein
MPQQLRQQAPGGLGVSDERLVVGVGELDGALREGGVVGVVGNVEVAGEHAFPVAARVVTEVVGHAHILQLYVRTYACGLRLSSLGGLRCGGRCGTTGLRLILCLC